MQSSLTRLFPRVQQASPKGRRGGWWNLNTKLQRSTYICLKPYILLAMKRRPYTKPVSNARFLSVVVVSGDTEVHKERDKRNRSPSLWYMSYKTTRATNTRHCENRTRWHASTTHMTPGLRLLFVFWSAWFSKKERNAVRNATPTRRED